MVWSWINCYLKQTVAKLFIYLFFQNDWFDLCSALWWRNTFGSTLLTRNPEWVGSKMVSGVRSSHLNRSLITKQGPIKTLQVVQVQQVPSRFSGFPPNPRLACQVSGWWILNCQEVVGQTLVRQINRHRLSQCLAVCLLPQSQVSEGLACASLPLKVAERCLTDTVVQCHCQSAEPRTAFGEKHQQGRMREVLTCLPCT